ncbi:17338_t:CDS:1, partial [Funneliformis caledonium]
MYRKSFTLHKLYKNENRKESSKRQQNNIFSHKRRSSSFDNKNPLHQHSHIKFSTALTPDCFAEILAHLQDDKSTLYNCLLLNRLCCRLVVPLLWR